MRRVDEKLAENRRSSFLTVQAEPDFGLSDQNKHLPSKSIPIVFRNASLRSVNIDGLTDSILIRNVFEFESIDDKNVHNSSVLNSQVRYLALTVCKISLTERILDANVFNSITSFTIVGQISAISASLFAAFRDLTSVNIANANFVEFFHRVGIEWTR